MHRARCVEVERGVDAGQHPIEVDVGVAHDARGVRGVRGAAADGARLVLQGVEDPPHLGIASTARVSGAMVSGAMVSRWSHAERSHGEWSLLLQRVLRPHVCCGCGPMAVPLTLTTCCVAMRISGRGSGARMSMWQQ